MSNDFTGRGNLAAAPELKTVTVNGENRQVAEMRVFFDRPVPDGNGGFTDKGGFWLNVSRWGNAAQHVARVLDKGFRIRVQGTLVNNEWSKDGEDRSRLELTADDITLDLSRIESVTRRERRSTGNDTQAGPSPTANQGVAEETATGD